MKVTLYKNLSANNVVNKSLTQIGSVLNCEAYKEFSRRNPRIILNRNDTAITSCNYFYLDSTARYYYVDDIVVLNGHKMMIVGHTDVLKSFTFGSCNCIADRTSDPNKYNKDITDDFILKKLQTKQSYANWSDSNTFLTTHSTKSTPFNAVSSSNYRNYVLTMKGRTDG